MEEALSPRDLKILNYLLGHDLQNYNKMSRETGMPASTIYDRVKAMRSKGIISRMAPCLDLERLGYRVFAALEIEVNNMRDTETLGGKYLHMPKVLGLFKMSGNYDMLMLVLVKSPNELEEMISGLLKEPEVKDVHGNLGMHSYKFSQNPGAITE